MTTNNDESNEPQEIDQLKYLGYKVPYGVILPWVVLAAFIVYYSLMYTWPDLKAWMAQ